MSNVIEFGGITKLDIEPDKVLESAKGLETVFVVGWDKEGDLYAASSTSNLGELLILIERAKEALLDQ